MKTKKLEKNEVGYMKRSATPFVCSNCIMFRFPMKCSLVKGKIQGEGWCRHWERPADLNQKEHTL